jgi:exopolysaccharide production protein ExoZ
VRGERVGAAFVPSPSGSAIATLELADAPAVAERALAVPRTIEPIQHLRAVAAIGVALHHSIAQVYGNNGHAYGRLGAAGVDLFFVISGFIMWVTAISRDEAPGKFVLKRLLRIVPLYWLVTTLVLAIVLVKPQLMRSASFDAAHAVASYLFIAWPHPKFTGMFWPVVVPGWTLDYEMFFYAIVTVSLAFALRWRAMIICAVLVALAVLGSTLAPMTIAGFYTDPILLEFALGIAIGVCFTRRAALPRGVAYALIVLGMGLFVVLGPLETDANRLVCWGVPMALLVLGSVNAPTILPGRAFRVLGDASYSIYLTQFCTIAPAAAVVNSVFHGAAGKVLATVALIAVAVGGGVVAYGLVERPLTRVVKGALSRDR